LKLISSIYLAKEGHRIKELRKKTVKSRELNIPEDVARIPRPERPRLREFFQKVLTMPFPRIQQRVSHDKLSAAQKLYMKFGKKYLMRHARVVTLMNDRTELKRGVVCRAVLKVRHNDGRMTLQAWDELEAREHKEQRQLRLMATGWIEPEDDRKERTLHRWSEVSMFTTTPRGGMGLAAVGTTDKSKGLSKSWESASMPKRKSPLSNVMSA